MNQSETVITPPGELDKEAIEEYRKEVVKKIKKHVDKQAANENDSVVKSFMEA